MCGATAYLAELRVQQNRKSDADTLYVEACAACGADSLDFHDLVLAYDGLSDSSVGFSGKALCNIEPTVFNAWDLSNELWPNRS